MMKGHLTRLGMLTAVAVAGASHVAAQSPCATSKVAFIQSAVILNSIPTYIRAESLLANQYNSYKLELQKAGAAFDSAQNAYQEKSALLSASAKAAEIKKLQAQGQALQARTSELDQKMADQRQQLLQPIETRVSAVIDGMRAEYNCALILDASAQGSGIASADKSLDLTQRVIDRLKTSETALPSPTTGGGGGTGGVGTKPPPGSTSSPRTVR